MDAITNLEVLKNLLAKLERAGWINRWLFMPSLRIDYTPLGAARMTELAGDFHRASLRNWDDAFLEQWIEGILKELTPDLTKNEFETLGYLAGMFRLRESDALLED